MVPRRRAYRGVQGCRLPAQRQSTITDPAQRHQGPLGHVPLFVRQPEHRVRLVGPRAPTRVPAQARWPRSHETRAGHLCRRVIARDGQSDLAQGWRTAWRGQRPLRVLVRGKRTPLHHPQRLDPPRGQVHVLSRWTGVHGQTGSSSSCRSRSFCRSRSSRCPMAKWPPSRSS